MEGFFGATYGGVVRHASEYQLVELVVFFPCMTTRDDAACWHLFAGERGAVSGWRVTGWRSTMYVQMYNYPR